MIRNLARGLYDYPAEHPKLGLLAPSVDAVARALKMRDAIKLQPSGAYAANLLGLSEQVPMKVVFLTDGPSRRVAVGKREIILRGTTPRNMATAGRISGTVAQALRWLGKDHVDDEVVSRLRQRLSANDKSQLLKDLRRVPAWVADVFRKIASHEAFFPFSRTDDDTMARGSLRIVPEGSLVATWEADYRAMREAMFSGQPPEFGEILRVVEEFERTFNEVHSAE